MNSSHNLHLWSALVLGVMGSLHCAGMCGPLTLLLTARGGARSAALLSRLAYQTGRVLTYCLLGAAFGLMGGTLAGAGFQRGLSIAMGSVLLIGVLAGSSGRWAGLINPWVGFIKTRLSQLMGRPGLGSQFLFGSVNGLLPCGLVYIACAGAAATGAVWSAVQYMAVFGMGTVPMLLAVSFLRSGFPVALRFRLQRWIPACVALVGMMLIVRGLSLGIPYLSPDLSGVADPRCH